MVAASVLSSCGRRALARRPGSWVPGAQQLRAQLLQGAWAPPRPGILPVFLPWQAGSSTEPPGESLFPLLLNPHIYPFVQVVFFICHV